MPDHFPGHASNSPKVEPDLQEGSNSSSNGVVKLENSLFPTPLIYEIRQQARLNLVNLTFKKKKESSDFEKVIESQIFGFFFDFALQLFLFLTL